MRLSSVSSQHAIHHRIMFSLIRKLSGHEAPDAFKTLAYRPAFFGRAFSALLQDTLRGPSKWSIGDRELMAAFTANLNQCTFCTEAHCSAARVALGREDLRSELDDWRSSDFPRGLTAALGLIEKLTLDPESLGPADREPLVEAGLDDEQIEDAIDVASLFNVITRLADGLGFEVPGPEYFRDAGPVLLKVGYRLRG